MNEKKGLAQQIKKKLKECLEIGQLDTTLDGLKFTQGLEKIIQLTPGNIQEEEYIFRESAENSSRLLFIDAHSNQHTSYPLFRVVLSKFADFLFSDTLFSNFFTADLPIRLACVELISSSLAVTLNHAEELMRTFSEISIHSYEKKEAKGIIYLHTEESIKPNLIRFLESIPLSNVRGIRKMIEVGNSQIVLEANSKDLFGFGSLEKRLSEESGVFVEFEGSGTWNFWQNGAILFHVRVGQPQLPIPHFSKERFIRHYSLTFGQSGNKEKLLDLLENLLHQNNGTNVLITQNAAKAAERLSPQCTLIKPTQVGADLLLAISGIDGTVILDQDGLCYGFGAILDGSVSPKGNPARGGRYNSAVMHCENSEFPCLLLVVSQDKTVDIISRYN